MEQKIMKLISGQAMVLESHISACDDCVLTCYLVWSFGETWCSHHCETLSFLQLMPSLASVTKHWQVRMIRLSNGCYMYVISFLLLEERNHIFLTNCTYQIVLSISQPLAIYTQFITKMESQATHIDLHFSV